MVNSQIQQGSHGSHQVLTVSETTLSLVREFVHEFEAKINLLGLPATEHHEARSDIASVEAQLSSPKPKAGIIAEGLRSMRTILEGAAANAVASDLLPKLLPLILALGN
jgi:hypothetical protein